MKKLIALILSVLIIIGTFVQSFSVFAEDDKKQIGVFAESSENITIKKDEMFSTEEDYDGELSLTAGYFDIERDYSQSCSITVKNTTESTIEYYLTVQNIYDDLYMNFVRNGSVEKPLIIAAGEEQSVDLDIFAQNAKHGEYILPIFAYKVFAGKYENCAKTTAYLSCPIVSLNVSLTKDKEDEHTLAQTFTLKNNGDYLTDVNVSLVGQIKDYVDMNPLLLNCPMRRNETVQFKASPDLTKMKNGGVSSISGEMVVSCGGSEKRVPVVFDTKGQEIKTSTIGEIVEYQFSKSGDTLSTKGSNKGSFSTEIVVPQCTNVGKVSVNPYLPSISGNDALSTAAVADKEAGVRVFLTSRMYGGGYVNKADTNYDYYINGVKVITSKNTGLTEISIAELPVEYIKFGAMNTIVRDYDTNPGSHFVTADTKITVIYPSDTPVSYVGSPDTLPDFRCLPDYTIYSENIFAESKDMIIGKSGKIGCNIYNIGSENGKIDIVVEDEDGVIYSEKDHVLNAFSSDKIVFDWIPKKESTKITVKLINNEDLDEESITNNEASAQISARKRAKPVISGISPAYLAEGEGVISATISNAQDVTNVEFYIDGQLYQGEVKSSLNSHTMKSWINNPTLEKGTHTIRVVATYQSDEASTDNCEFSSRVDVLDKNWNKYDIEFTQNVAYPDFYLYNNSNKSYRNISYYVDRLNGKKYQYTIDKQMYDAFDSYYICAVLDDGFVYKQASDTKSIDLSSRNKLTLKHPDQLDIESLEVIEFENKNIYADLWSDDELLFTPGKYKLSISAYWLGEYNSFDVEVDLSEKDCVIDLGNYITNYRFSFADEVLGDPSAVMYYKTSESTQWNVLDLVYEYENGILTCLVPSYNRSILASAKEAFVCVITNDSVFTVDVDKNNNSSVISLNKSAQQKYTVSANDNGADFDIYEVSVTCDKFSVLLYSNIIYLPKGEYNIVVYCKENEKLLLTEAVAGDLVTYADISDKNEILINWSDSFLDRKAFVNLTDSNGRIINISECENGNKIKVEKSKYNIETSLVRNNSKYVVSSKVDALSGDAKILIDDEFVGKIANSFGTVEGNSSIRIFIDKLVDKNGNQLIEFNSQNADDNLQGYVILVNTETKEEYKIPVSLDSVSYFDIDLPNVDGEFIVKLEVKTNNELYRPVSGITIAKNEVTVNCGKTYQIEANVLPGNATNQKLIWNSSDKKVAKVDENGLVKAGTLKPGSTIITVTTEDGSYSAQCKVTVKFAWWQYLICILFGSAVLAAIIALI